MSEKLFTVILLMETALFALIDIVVLVLLSMLVSSRQASAGEVTTCVFIFFLIVVIENSVLFIANAIKRNASAQAEKSADIVKAIEKLGNKLEQQTKTEDK